MGPEHAEAARVFQDDARVTRCKVFLSSKDPPLIDEKDAQ